MKPSHSIFDPLTLPELSTLRNFASDKPPKDMRAVESLTERGYLQKTKVGVIVTPEGLAALLDNVPIEQVT